MVVHLVKKQGVPAFACPSSDHSVLWPCSLVMLHDKPAAQPVQFAVQLEASVRLHGIEDEQHLVLSFDGDNLVPDKASLRPINVSLDTIRHEDYLEPRMLSLTLKEPCSVWYPRALGSDMARLDTPCRELVALASTTKVHVFFDGQWLGRKRGLLQQAVQTSSQLASVPLLSRNVFAHTYLHTPASILNLVEDADAALPSIEDARDDVLPPYERVSGKRARLPMSSTPPTHDKHLSKRLQANPWASPPRKRASPAPSTSSNATVEVDVFQELVQKAVDKALPDALRAEATLQNLVSSTVTAVLPSILQSILPSLLPPPPPPPTVIVPGPLNAHFHARLTTILDTAASAALDDMSNAADDAHHRLRAELSEELADHKVDVQMVKEDHLCSFERECGERREEFAEGIREAWEMVEDDVDAWARGRINEVEEEGEKAVRKVMDRLDEQGRTVPHRSKCFHCRKCTCEAEHERQSSRRAMSMPLL
jgi:hypothetical protein